MRLEELEDMEQLMKLSSFQAWLNSLPPETRIGISRCADGCPLATYLEDKTGLSLYVRDAIYMRERNEKEDMEHVIYGMPPWAKVFVRAVDTQPATHEISVQEAKDILDMMEEVRQNHI